VATTKQIVERLIEAVPPPRAAPPRPQGSWATLKLGDVLVAPGCDSGESGGRELWEVVAVSSAGVTIDSLNNSKLLDDRNWKENGWRKLAKRKLKERTGDNP
jgi:hypothetical protein